MGIQSSKLWHDRRSKKLHKAKKHRKQKGGSNYSGISLESDIPKYDFMGEYKAIAPAVFSFIDNLDGTAKMFAELIEAIRNGSHKKRFFLDSSCVENVSADVILYIIAIIRNIKINRLKQYVFVGNLPQNSEATKVYIESGLYKYVQSKKQELPSNNSKMQIASAKRTDGQLAAEMCQFIMDKFSVDMTATQYVYKTIIEMMSNTVYHAYNSTKDEIMYPCWYMYAEYTGNIIRLIFLDTGMGIAATVRKKFPLEQHIRKDSELIESAFFGEFRTETKKDHRGLGLPALKEYAETKKFKSFVVLSGNGGYKCEEDGTFKKFDFKNKIFGTIYVIDIENIGEKVC